MRQKQKVLRPDNDAIRDSWKMRLRLENMMDKTNEGKGKNVKLNLELPEELITLAAWLAIRGKRYEEGNFITTDVSDIIKTPISNEQYKAAGGFICDIVFKNLMESQYEAICQNAHPYLFENPNIDTKEENNDLPF